MRAFIILCLVAATVALPQGYNYQQKPLQFGHSSSSSGSHSNVPSFLEEALQNTKLMQTLLGNQQNSFPSLVPQSILPRPQQQQLVQQQQQHHHQQVVHHQQQLPVFQGAFNAQPQLTQSFGLAPIVQHHQQQQQVQHHHQQQQQQFTQQYPTQHTPIITKDIYVHVAPEEPEEQRLEQPVPVGPPRKHYRIVFIKAPTQNINTAALRVKQAPTEEKTIIYVLTKKPDPIDLEAALQEVAPKQPSKPEVYFIKYKTQEEAQHAQRTIQAQYDQLGGTTQISDEGIAPVTSVIGALDHQQHGGSSATGSGYVSNSNNVVSGSSKYLPPIVRI